MRIYLSSNKQSGFIETECLTAVDTKNVYFWERTVVVGALPLNYAKDDSCGRIFGKNLPTERFGVH